MLPFLSPEARKLHAEFHLNEPWDSEHNRQLIARMPKEFQVPDVQLEPGHTCYVAVVNDDVYGAFTVIQSGDAGSSIDRPRGRNLGDVEDGPNKTLMLVQVDQEHSVAWTAPEDLMVDVQQPNTGLADVRDGCFLAAAVDATVYKLPLGMSPECFLHLFLCNDSMTVEPL